MSKLNIKKGDTVYVLSGVISLFVRGLNQGIDFSGGRNYVVKFEKPVKT